MTTYIAFLRGINVGVHNRMTMDELRTVFESLGYDDIETHIQSGNVVFKTPESDEEALRDDIHDAIEDVFGYDITVMIRARTELQDVMTGQPFDVSAENDIKHYSTFLDEEPTDEQVDALLDAQNEAESLVVSSREVYSELDTDALGDGRFTDVENILGMAATRRNWDVVTAVRELSE